MTIDLVSRTWSAAIAALIVAGAMTIPTASANRVQPTPVVAEDAAEAETENVELDAGYRALEAGQYETAIKIFQAALADDPSNAEVYNQLGYINRRLQNFAQAFTLYAKALELDPGHTAAHNYVGEAFLEVGDLDRAEHHLRQLDLLCLFGCDDFYELEQAVALYKANHSS